MGIRSLFRGKQRWDSEWSVEVHPVTLTEWFFSITRPGVPLPPYPYGREELLASGRNVFLSPNRYASAEEAALNGEVFAVTLWEAVRTGLLPDGVTIEPEWVASLLKAAEQP